MGVLAQMIIAKSRMLIELFLCSLSFQKTSGFIKCQQNISKKKGRQWYVDNLKQEVMILFMIIV